MRRDPTDEGLSGERTGSPRARPPSFRVGDVLAQNDPRSAVVLVVLIASRELASKTRAAFHGLPAGDDHERRAIHGMIGAAKEAMDAFRVADHMGCFKHIPGIDKELERARHESDATVAESLYRMLQRVRNQAAFHWDRDRIQRALTDLQADVFRTYEEAGPNEEKMVPLLGAITAKVLAAFGIFHEARILPRLAQLGEALWALGDALYAHWVQAAQPPAGSSEK